MVGIGAATIAAPVERSKIVRRCLARFADCSRFALASNGDLLARLKFRAIAGSRNEGEGPSFTGRAVKVSGHLVGAPVGWRGVIAAPVEVV